MAKQSESSTDPLAAGENQSPDDAGSAPKPSPDRPATSPDRDECSDSMLVSQSTQPSTSCDDGTDAALVSQPESANLDIESLIDQHHAAVYRYGYRLTGNQADAEDLAQQTFLIAHQKLAQVRDDAKAGGWLMTITRSCFLKSIRRRRPMNETSLQISVDQIPRETIAAESIDQMALQDALMELPEDYRTVVLMFYFEHLSYKEIADQLGIKIGTVMSRLSRAKGTLRHALIGNE